MPELPEVETLRIHLIPDITGKVIRAVAIHRLEYLVPSNAMPWESLKGRTIRELGRHGKLLWLAFEDGTRLLVHLGMSGRILLRRDDLSEKHTHFQLHLKGGGRVDFSDPRRFGYLQLLAPGDPLPEYLATLGPDALTSPAKVLTQALGAHRGEIKALLLNQRVLAGVGNIYADESLFRAGIHPLRRVESLTSRQLSKLTRCVQEVLTEAVQCGGTTLVDGGYRRADGAAGEFAGRLRIYGRKGQMCLVCGGPIETLTAAGRTSHCCPRCQKGGNIDGGME